MWGEKTHSTAQSLLLPAGDGTVEIMFGESHGRELRKIPLAHNTMGRRVSDISEELCDKFIGRLKISHSAFQVNEGTEIVKGAHNYVRLVYARKFYKEGFFCFSNLLMVGLIPEGVQYNHFLEKNEINWESCNGLH
jgi:hypothetical protein